MAIISQETWDNMPENEKQQIRDEYNSQVEETIAGHWMRQCMEIHFGKENLQPKHKIRTWKDMREEYMLRADFGTSYIIDMDKKCYSEKLALKALATLQIAKLIEFGYGGMVSDEEWRNEDINKFSIVCEGNRLSISCLPEERHFISFHYVQQAEEFLSYPENVELVKQYHMI